ncbi:MAG: WecB/TagA/CpsF family glycosyltransferase [Anaerolineaceae bacterium]|nr:WecB/TagA/CpsF family glycosyltransferase [Anaerolineaceae bacterium]
MTNPKTKLLGVNISRVSIAEILTEIQDTILNNTRNVISYSNIHAINLAYKFHWFRRFLNRSEINLCDGYGVNLGLKLIGEPTLLRNTPPDWIDELFEVCSLNGYKVFLLGAKAGIVEKIIKSYGQLMPNLIFSGGHHGYFNKEISSIENQRVVFEINNKPPDILLVGFGMPIQEKWILENYDQLDAKVIIPVGALFDYMAGNVKRSPKWMTNNGMEWLGRLIIEPKRLWYRYIIGIPLFFYRVFLQKFGILKFDE